MSYTRTYHSQITVNGIVHYPASSSGGSMPVSLTEPVELNVTVDTSPFDSAVNLFAGKVDAVQGAVVQTSARQMQEKAADAQVISVAATKGFEGLVLQEIRQQLEELQNQIRTKTLLLQQTHEAMQSTKSQFMADL